MRVTIERLRTGILVLAFALVAAILLFFVYARWRVRHVGRDLPARLGIEIQQSTNGFTLSKSEGGQTLFTLHASKAVQYKGAGRAVLHDVSITVFSRNGGGADHIAGKDFEYDPSTGVARALGEVEIDVAPPAARGRAQPQPIRLKTSGLIFQQKTALATTSAPVEFSFPAASGSARGATYDSQRGLLTLQSDVVFRSQVNRKQLAVHAANAQFNRGARQLTLLRQRADYDGEETTSDQALITFRPDGTAERVNARGQVNVTGEGPRTLHSSAADVQLNAQGQPEQAVFDGGLVFRLADKGHDVHGDAGRGTMQLEPHGGIRHLRLENAANVVDQQNAPPGNPRGSVTRQVLASRLDIDFEPSADGHSQPRMVVADGAANADEHAVYGNGPPQDTRVQASRLVATLRGGKAMESLRGAGNTVLTRLSPDGSVETSSGDSLDVSFAPEGAAAAPAARQAGVEARPGGKGTRSASANASGVIESAVQRGNVRVVQTSPAAHGKPASRSVATAEEADYDGKTQTLQLRGGTPRLTDEAADVTASAISFQRLTGDATAEGGVTATYRAAARGANEASGEPTHVAADRAVFHKAQDTAVFTAAGGEVRLWQGADSISAPQIVLARKLQTLTARGSGANAVHAVFYQPPAAKVGTRKAEPTALPAVTGGSGAPQVMRVSSAELVYSAAERKAQFSGGVVARQGSAELRADRVDLYQTPTPAAALSGTAATATAAAAEAAAAAAPGGLGGAIERLVAEGNVVLTEPGERGSGERLTYTAAEGRWELTGTPGRPPRLRDQAHGNVTGSALIFNDRDGSVEINGGQSQSVTETRSPR